jgi:hypothetical protein
MVRSPSSGRCFTGAFDGASLKYFPDIRRLEWVVPRKSTTMAPGGLRTIGLPVGVSVLIRMGLAVG